VLVDRLEEIVSVEFTWVVGVLGRRRLFAVESPFAVLLLHPASAEPDTRKNRPSRAQRDGQYFIILAFLASKGLSNLATTHATPRPACSTTADQDCWDFSCCNCSNYGERSEPSPEAPIELIRPGYSPSRSRQVAW